MQGLQTISLFSGIGGIELALERAGATTKLLCEFDPNARAVLARHFPNAQIHNDVQELTADDCRAAGAIPGRTVLTAGFPCTDLSIAGRRRGMGQGTRSGLYWHADRLLAEFRPAWVILENVPGLLSATCPCAGDGACGGDCPGELHTTPGGACPGGCISTHGGAMGAVLGSLAQRGYGFAYRVLDARNFGVPQRRRRVVVVARLGDTGAAPAQVLLEPESGTWNPAQNITPRQSPARTARAGSAAGRWTVTQEHAPTLTSRSWKGPDSDASEPFVVGVLGDHTHTLTAEGHDASEDGTGRGTPVVAYTPDLANALVSHGGNDKHDPSMMTYVAHEVSTLTAAGGDRGYRVDAETAAGGHLVAYAADTAATLQSTHRGVPSAEEAAGGQLVAFSHTAGLDVQAGPLSPTLKAGHNAGPSVTDGVIVRRLSPTECERLQGYPDGWTVGQADSHRYKQLGNSVAVPVFEWVARRIAAVDAHLAVL